MAGACVLIRTTERRTLTMPPCPKLSREEHADCAGQCQPMDRQLLLPAGAPTGRTPAAAAARRYLVRVCAWRQPADAAATAAPSRTSPAYCRPQSWLNKQMEGQREQIRELFKHVRLRGAAAVGAGRCWGVLPRCLHTHPWSDGWQPPMPAAEERAWHSSPTPGDNTGGRRGYRQPGECGALMPALLQVHLMCKMQQGVWTMCAAV